MELHAFLHSITTGEQVIMIEITFKLTIHFLMLRKDYINTLHTQKRDQLFIYKFRPLLRSLGHIDQLCTLICNNSHRIPQLSRFAFIRASPHEHADSWGCFDVVNNVGKRRSTFVKWMN